MMKRFVLAIVLIATAAVLSGCIQQPIESQKYCKEDEDCRIMYNVLYEGKCSAGCFNRNVEADSSCDLKWGLIAGDCKCINNRCEIVEAEGTELPNPCAPVFSIEGYTDDSEFLTDCFEHYKDKPACKDTCYDQASIMTYKSNPEKSLLYCQTMENFHQPCFTRSYTGFALEEKGIASCANIKIFSGYRDCVLSAVEEIAKQDLNLAIDNCLSAYISSETVGYEIDENSIKSDCIALLVPSMVERDPNEAINVCNNISKPCPEGAVIDLPDCQFIIFQEINKQYPENVKDYCDKPLCSKSIPECS